jgi:hypothetical protein
MPEGRMGKTLIRFLRHHKRKVKMDEYKGEERRQYAHLSDEQVERIAERAAEVALERVYTNVGKSVVKSFLWLVGAGALAVAAWLNGSGHLKI